MRNRIDNTKDDLLETYCRQMKVFPLLTFEEELELSRKVQKGDTEALHKLINANLRIVVKIAKMFETPDISIMDLIQEGNWGLVHAAQKYDYRKNVRFCTYAIWWIRQSISRYITNKNRIVRLPHRQAATLRKIQRTYHFLSQTLMHQPRNVDIADELGIPVQDVDFIINMTAGHLSLESVSCEGEASSRMEVHEDYTYSPERNLMKQSSHDGAMRILNKLKDHEKQVINYRYQLNGCKRKTLREIGDKLDVSPETVRQIEMRALKKIRSHANELRECVYN